MDTLLDDEDTTPKVSPFAVSVPLRVPMSSPRGLPLSMVTKSGSLLAQQQQQQLGSSSASDPNATSQLSGRSKQQQAASAASAPSSPCTATSVDCTVEITRPVDPLNPVLPSFVENRHTEKALAARALQSGISFSKPGRMAGGQWIVPCPPSERSFLQQQQPSSSSSAGPAKPNGRVSTAAAAAAMTSAHRLPTSHWVEPHPSNLRPRGNMSVAAVSEFPSPLLQRIFSFSEGHVLDQAVVLVSRQWRSAVNEDPLLKSRRLAFEYSGTDYDGQGIIRYFALKVSSLASSLAIQQQQRAEGEGEEKQVRRGNQQLLNALLNPARGPNPTVELRCSTLVEDAAKRNNAHKPVSARSTSISNAEPFISQSPRHRGTTSTTSTGFSSQPRKPGGGQHQQQQRLTDRNAISARFSRVMSSSSSNARNSATNNNTKASSLSTLISTDPLPNLANLVSCDVSHFQTESIPYAWAGIDFKSFRVRPTAYTIGTSVEAERPSYPLEWELQGSTHGGGSDWGACEWRVLDRRKGNFFSSSSSSTRSELCERDDSLLLSASSSLAEEESAVSAEKDKKQKKKLSCTFTVSYDTEAAKALGAFRRLRIVQTGRNVHWGHELQISGLEFYGRLYKVGN